MWKTAAKWIGLIIGALIGVLFLGVGIVYAISSSHFNENYEIEVAELEMPEEPESVGWGEHIAKTRGCQDCHGEHFGGTTVMNNVMMGNIQGANLTSGKGGIGKEYSDEDWVRAIRHGIGPDSEPLLFMPSHEYNALGKRDLSALIAYLKTVEPVDNVVPEPAPGPMMRFLYLRGKIPLVVSAEMIDHSKPVPKAPPVESTRRYGEYLSEMCKGCHGETFSGGPIPGVPPSYPPATNLTPHETGIKNWSREDWEEALTKGALPSGEQMSTEYMPWNLTKRMKHVERTALYKYFMSIEAKPEGNR